MSETSPPLPGGPQRLAFLDLGERLRQRGQLDAAASVARAGLTHYPTLPEAHDLAARIAADQGDDGEAAAAWEATLACAPGHLGALKGLAFLAFRRQDYEAAQDRLEVAAALAPHDTAILAALDRVRTVRPLGRGDAPPQLGAADAGMLLLDAQGLRLVGHVGDATEATADAAAAEAAGLAHEVARTSQLLRLGTWREVIVEGRGGRCIAMPLDDAHTLLVQRPVTTPVGRLRALAARGVVAARAWLGGDAS